MKKNHETNETAAGWTIGVNALFCRYRINQASLIPSHLWSYLRCVQWTTDAARPCFEREEKVGKGNETLSYRG